MSSRSGRSKKPKSKSWKVKDKGVAKSRNRGLPGSFIKTYGKPVARQLISKDVWEAFYNSDKGMQRGADLWARAQERDAELTNLAGLVRQPAVKALNDKNKLSEMVKDNAKARADAKGRTGTRPGEERIVEEGAVGGS